MVKLSHRMSEPVTEAVLAVKDLSVILSREGRPSRILDRISFDMSPGEIIALVGESGSGKSSIGLTLQGLLPREHLPQVAGSIRLAGIELVGARARTCAVGPPPPCPRHLARSDGRAQSYDDDPPPDARIQSAGDEASIENWLSRTGLA